MSSLLQVRLSSLDRLEVGCGVCSFTPGAASAPGSENFIVKKETRSFFGENCVNDASLFRNSGEWVNPSARRAERPLSQVPYYILAATEGPHRAGLPRDLLDESCLHAVSQIPG